ncbi:hypothetical protein QVZ41_03960 [Wenyingzhuangia sp. chi5]|uniref:Uncharacterized protein n=1 Tax=Wenyingzhuangia gilva TaxID=3057677 RepID=A0ABT8VPV1_9FLAO|nr:hypothetical protein [Wenyingzhuangia sp. chi5]MDO3694005.1 hypothetical protein [Wenyingzhuangia sp. chi5]
MDCVGFYWFQMWIQNSVIEELDAINLQNIDYSAYGDDINVKCAVQLEI